LKEPLDLDFSLAPRSEVDPNWSDYLDSLALIQRKINI
jgi:hypothetical protein